MIACRNSVVLGLTCLLVSLWLTASSPLSSAYDRSGPSGKNKARFSANEKLTAQEQLSKTIPADAGDPQAPILFCIGIHIEPFGATVSTLVNDNTSKRSLAKEKSDYNNVEYLRMHIDNIKKIAQIVEKHGGKLTVQAQTPFTSSCYENNEKILTDLAEKGHEIALHFHEDAHLGKNSGTLDPAVWTAVMKEEISWLKKAGAGSVRYWSGGNIYPHILEAASNAGLEVMSDYKNPKKQEADASLLAINPWRPAGEPSEGDVTAFSKHDPNGKIIYLPDGIFKSSDFKERKTGGSAAFLDYLTDGLERSLRAAKRDRVNVFHITLHPGELKGPGGRGVDILDAWLTQVVDPLVRKGKLKWATFSEMADKYAAWEILNPTANAQQIPEPAAKPSAQVLPKKGYMTFAVNVHDWVNINESADTIIRLVDIFNKYKVRGDFYFTAPTVEAYVNKRPDVIKKVKDSGMTISYHVRPPSPIYNGFEAPLKNLDDARLKQTLTDYETYGLDLRTGGLDRSRSGGYSYVAKIFARAPVVASPQASDNRIRTACEDIYKSMGAKMEVLYHEEGTPVDNPFQYKNGLLLRPSDFSITRWRLPGEENDSFWWNRLMRNDADKFDPVAKLKEGLASWRNSRMPFITALIHENNFYNSGAETWKAYYLTGKQFRTPLPPPYNLNAPDPSKPRSKQEQDKIWKTYEDLVAYAAANLDVVTSEDIVKLAGQTN